MADVLKVLEVIDETPEARSFVLEVPPGWSYQPGQFLTVKVDGVARNYSMSSSPYTGELPKITVKRMPSGHASNWICDNITAGSELETLRPGGRFSPHTLDSDFMLFAGGSGITPVMSILKSALVKGAGKVTLLYANRDTSSVIFAAELAALIAKYPDRLTVIHWLDVLQNPPTPSSIKELAKSGEVFVCGPDPFMECVLAALPDRTVHIERFMSLTDDPFAAPEASERTATVTVTIDSRTHTFPWPVNTKLLDLFVEKGLNPPFSCRKGNCAACACRILSGEVKLINNEVLEEEDFADGYILACQALPVTDEVTVTYEP